MGKQRNTKAEARIKRLGSPAFLLLISLGIAGMLKGTRAEAVVEPLVQLNSQVLWLSWPIFLGVLVVAPALKHDEKHLFSFHRVLAWGCVALSPLSIGFLTVTADYLGGECSVNLLVWQSLVSVIGNVPDFTVSLAAQIEPLISPRAVHFTYFVWLIFFGLYHVCERVRTWAFLRFRDAGPYMWPSSSEEQIFSELCKQFRLKWRPELIEVADDISPFTFGVWRPRVVTPSALHRSEMDLADLKALWAHELAHVKYQHGAVHLLLDIVLWLFPLSHWFLSMANRHLEHGIELSADAAAVRVCGVDKEMLEKVWGKYRERELFDTAVGTGVDEGKVEKILKAAKGNASLLRHLSLGRRLFAAWPLTRLLLGLAVGTVVGHLDFSLPLPREEQTTEPTRVQEMPLEEDEVTRPSSSGPGEQGQDDQPRREGTVESPLDEEVTGAYAPTVFVYSLDVSGSMIAASPRISFTNEYIDQVSFNASTIAVFGEAEALLDKEVTRAYAPTVFVYSDLITNDAYSAPLSIGSLAEGATRIYVLIRPSEILTINTNGRWLADLSASIIVLSGDETISGNSNIGSGDMISFVARGSSGTLAEVAHTLISANALDGTTVTGVAAHSSGVYPSSFGSSGITVGKTQFYSRGEKWGKGAVASRDEIVTVGRSLVNHIAGAQIDRNIQPPASLSGVCSSYGYETEGFTVLRSGTDDMGDGGTALARVAEEVRKQAATALGKIGPEAKVAVPALVKALKDEGDVVRAEVAKVLIRAYTFSGTTSLRGYKREVAASYLQKSGKNVIGAAPGTAVRYTVVHSSGENRDGVGNGCTETGPMSLLVAIWSVIWITYLSIRNGDGVGGGCNGMEPPSLLVTVWSPIWAYLSMLSLFESALRMRKHRRKL